MKTLINIFLLAGLFLCQACSNEEEIDPVVNASAEVKFAALLLDKQSLGTRALGDEKGDEVSLPYINGIYVRKQEDMSTAIYAVQNGHKGTLENIDASLIQWEKDLKKEIHFYGWTTPSGVSIDKDAIKGIVDFKVGNIYQEADINQLNENYVIPLEAFIGCPVVTSTRETSPSVTLKFKHLVSKLSIRVRNWHNQEINDQVRITFLGIKDKWNVSKDDDTGFQIKGGDVLDESKSITFDLSTFPKNVDEKDLKFKKLYLPPLTKELGTDFKTAGDFCIEYGNKKYFGTLNKVEQNTNDNFIQLQAGEHLHVTMDLSENYGVGVGTKIEDWDYTEEDIIKGNPYNGIYTYDDLKALAQAVNAGEAIPALLIDKTTIRLYNNIKIEADWTPIGQTGSAFEKIFDGNGYTISGITGTGLFGVVKGSADAPATIQNLYLSGSVLAGASASAGLLAGSAEYADIKNCHVIDIKNAAGTVISSSSVSVTDASGCGGGLIGSVSGTGRITLANCSVETTGAISGVTGATLGALVGTVGDNGTNVANCFAVFNGAAAVTLVGSASFSGITYSYFWNISETSTSDNFWGRDNATGKIAFGTSDIFKISVTIDGLPTPLINALNAGDKGWVYVYGKDYPVLKIE